MNLKFDKLKCPNCGTKTMVSVGGSFSGRVNYIKQKCTECKLILFIVPMQTKIEYFIEAITKYEIKEKQENVNLP